MIDEDELMFDPLTFKEVEAWADEASAKLHELTGFSLPRATMWPLSAQKTTIFSKFNIEIPLGKLFHPCCGSDTSNALEIFKYCVTALHFVDPYSPPFWKEKINRSNYSTINVPYIESVVMGSGEHKQVEGEPTLHSHKKDGLLTFIRDMSSISVFYYRGDSHGEGGSNQNWLEPVLFHTVLAKLQEGGLIVTDGSNCGYLNRHTEIYAPWNMLCGRQPFRTPQMGDEFTYANRIFSCLGEIDSNSINTTWIWQVKSLDKI